MNKLFLIFIFIIPTCAVAKNQVVYFEPIFVELTGVVKKLTFPGPPNYASLRDGDISETGRYLILQDSIDVDLAPGEKQMGNDEFTPNVTILQLVVYKDSNWEKLKNNSHVRIKGSLFKAMTGHHHARVLLEVGEVYDIQNKEIWPHDIRLTKEDYEFVGGGDYGIDQDIIALQKIKLRTDQSYSAPSTLSMRGFESRALEQFKSAYSKNPVFFLHENHIYFSKSPVN
jgi:hypothetical protein